jgi:hypothetical protein
MPPLSFPQDRKSLFERGRLRVLRFCEENSVVAPELTAVPKEDWYVGVCAYYRPTYIKICLGECQHPCGHETNRNWSWPGNSTDRTPYGVVAHELGHHFDWLTGDGKGDYWSDFSTRTLVESNEVPLTSYCPNPPEWFAEHFRLFVTNPALLRLLRPRTFRLLARRWTPLPPDDWKKAMGANVPERVLKAARNKMR